jgi:predicted component of type VI protein secretion system
MTDPERLLSEGTQFERELLADAAMERPGAAMSRRMAVGVGVGGALGYTAMAKAMVASWWGKAVIGTVALGSLAVSAVVVNGEEPARVNKPAEPSVVQQAQPGIEAPAEPKAEPVEAVTGLETVEAEPAVTQPKPRAVPKKSTLAEEIRMIDQARALVNSGKQRQALSLLDRYSHKFPSGVLKHEAGVLRAQAKQGSQ